MPFYPTRRAVLLAGLGLPLTLALAVFSPALWAIGAAWIALVAGLMVYDLLFSSSPGQIELNQDIPASLYVGSKQDIGFIYSLKGWRKPFRPEMKLTVNDRLKVEPNIWYPPFEAPRLLGSFRVTAQRRGEAAIETVWLRWTGPLGLVWRQRVDRLNRTIAVIPDTRLVKDKAIEIFTRDAAHGLKMQIERGEGTEFDSLREFMPGMDKRAIDWKHSARHRKLHAKEFRTERNHNIVFAIDTGYLMSEPLKGMARVDWAINASLLISYISLKFGDRVGFFGFDKNPYLFSKPVAGTNSFPHLQKLTAQLEYSANETNFTLCLSQLSKSLQRRSLIIVFTDFIDTITAELMIENISRLIKSHVVLFVSFEDTELAALMNVRPKTPDDVTKAVLAGALDKERDVVLARLERMGVQIVRADIESMSTAVLNKFLDLKRREMI
ncbi:MAG TPA: DUF58 domain-containing protein [Hellea balneolensis]|uniref:DUF58 domain-containing protein n=1 Tax=Hellea balneolensis TaxID=287478 RepID=A0A7V5NWW8_9PROT|nr:DUF58 domain-containing protein [Hellea balneolensis]